MASPSKLYTILRLYQLFRCVYMFDLIEERRRKQDCVFGQEQKSGVVQRSNKFSYKLEGNNKRQKETKEAFRTQSLAF